MSSILRWIFQLTFLYFSWKKRKKVRNGIKYVSTKLRLVDFGGIFAIFLKQTTSFPFFFCVPYFLRCDYFSTHSISTSEKEIKIYDIEM